MTSVFRFYSTIPLVILSLAISASASHAQMTDWLSWRGPGGNGVAPGEQTPPTAWDAESNVTWRVKVPGRGHSSPTIVGNQIILTTADDTAETQSVLSYDRQTGERNWTTVINEGNFASRIHQKNTHASPTAVSDGERIYVVFNNNRSAQVAALGLDGEILWKKKAAEYRPRFPFGYAPSPLIYKDLVIVTSECDRLGAMVAYHGATGEERWRIDRDQATTFSSPVVGRVGGRDQLLISGANRVDAYDPNDGTEIWSSEGPWLVTCGTLVWSDDMVFASGGFPEGGTLGIRADGSGDVVWQNRVKCYEQSMLFHEGHIYAMSDLGVVYCWRASDGAERWSQRLSGPVSASPVLAGGNVYISVEKGTTYVFRPNPDKFELVAENKLGNSAFATPTIVDSQIFTRVGIRQDGGRQEWLYCLEKQ